ncbi:hypothetical protein Sta7437_1835 [Stanieria cyanosphaera PCC 7437]|uniref:Uncharacterized protein n=1 Tax=Stanieria cyanosphaera (strain ATCC 29371 / PCC 7437) TaxID=111780 RepID=K9XS82_STAC7|nr:hypothetical protein [Stanieria cyanosphaera]AFZ35393.1 hypothetical protein Sta7437_1835 [Stanieria cyanosphaera PCC 7437]
MSSKKLKSCTICNHLVDIRYRIKYQPEGEWVLVCPQCWQQVSHDNPNYRYGGTWKAFKKK